MGCINIAGLLFARAVRLEREVRRAVCVGREPRPAYPSIYSRNPAVRYRRRRGRYWLAFGLLQATTLLVAAALERGSEIHINVTVLLVSLFVAVLTSFLAGLAPALRLSGVPSQMALRSGGRTGTERGQYRLRTAFVVAQVSLALILLVTAGLVFRMLSALQHSDFGFDPEHILTAEIDLSPVNYEHRGVMANFYMPLLQRVQTIPRVKSAGLIQVVPIQSWGWNSEVHIAGYPPNPPICHSRLLLRFRRSALTRQAARSLSRHAHFTARGDRERDVCQEVHPSRR